MSVYDLINQSKSYFRCNLPVHQLYNAKTNNYPSFYPSSTNFMQQ